MNIQDEYSLRPTATGDGFLMTNGELIFKGIKIKRRHIPHENFIIGLSKFLILGFRTDATIKVEHSGAYWVWNWFVRVRFGTQYIKGGSVKLFEIRKTT
jgi:hypothetical protein